MKNTTFVLLCLVAVLAACGGDSSSSGGGTTAAGPGAEQPGPEQPTPEGGGALSGAAQKGPFQAGATARLQRLVNGAVDSDSAALETTVDERGRYAFPETGFVGPALLTVSGFWFDEGAGQFSGEPVTLSAVVFLEEGEQAVDANVNVLTDLISERLMAELAEHNDDYAAALAALMPDYRALTGLRRPPGQLDMLAGFIPRRNPGGGALPGGAGAAVAQRGGGGKRPARPGGGARRLCPERRRRRGRRGVLGRHKNRLRHPARRLPG